MVTNGQIPLSQLTPVGGGLYLSPGFATQWFSIVAEVRARYGVAFTITSPDGAYRSYARQQYWYSVYRKYGRPIAAVPGTSNHGLGQAVDIFNHASISRARLLDVMSRHNCTPDPTESWHFNYHGSANYGSTNSIPASKAKEGNEMKMVYHPKKGTTAPHIYMFVTSAGTRRYDGSIPDQLADAVSLVKLTGQDTLVTESDMVNYEQALGKLS